MASVFDDLDVGGGPGDLSPADLQQVMAMQNDPRFFAAGSGQSDYWYDPSKTYDPTTDTHGFMIDRSRGYRVEGTGEGSGHVADPTQDRTVIRRLRAGAAGKLGDMWDPQTGKYLGTYQAQDGGGRQMNTAIAMMAGGYFGGNYLSGLAEAGAGAGTYGGAGAEILGADVAGYTPGMGLNSAAGAGAGTYGGAGAEILGADTTGYTAGMGAGNAAPAANPTWWDTAKSVYNGADQFLNSGVGKLLGTGAALALSKDAEQGPADPLLQKAGDKTLDIGTDATNRANSNDDYYQSVFAPRYLELMNRADARDRELYDFNMGRARRAAGQMDRFYDEVDAYDSEGEQERAAGKAVASARQANSAQANMLMRRAMAMGLNPNSGAWGAGAAQLSSRAALNEVFAANMARNAAKREGLNLRATAAGLKGADGGYAGNAAAGANMGMNAVNAGQQGFNANSNLWNATTGLGLNAFSNAGGWGLSRSNSADSISAANTAGWNGLVGYGLGQFLNRGTTQGR